MTRLWLLALLGCSDSITAAVTGETPLEYVERECRERGWTCVRVYAFDEPADNPLGRVELCVRTEDLPAASELHGAYELSPDERFGQAALLGLPPICIWCAGYGCNAYDGCFACPEPIP